MVLYSQFDLFVLGIRRSGNHAIVCWLMPHYQGVVRYFNNYSFSEQMRPGNKHLEGRCTELFTIVKQKKYLLYIGKNNDIRYPPNWDKDNMKITVNANMFGCEGITPQYMSEFFNKWQELTYRRLTMNNNRQITDKRFFILILRNPFNLLASMRKWKIIKSSYEMMMRHQVIPRWIAYAKEYLGETSYLSKLGNVIILNYDFWFADQNYRKAISAQLQQPFTDAGLQEVTEHGYGSSFDGVAFSGKAQEMKVLERWKNFQNDREYISVLKNDELLSLYKQIYGDTPF